MAMSCAVRIALAPNPTSHTPAVPAVRGSRALIVWSSNDELHVGCVHEDQRIKAPTPAVGAGCGPPSAVGRSLDPLPSSLAPAVQALSPLALLRFSNSQVLTHVQFLTHRTPVPVLRLRAQRHVSGSQDPRIPQFHRSNFLTLFSCVRVDISERARHSWR